MRAHDVKMGLVALGLVAAAVGLGASARAEPPAKVGLVDLQRCLNESVMGKRYKAEFSAQMEEMKGELDREEAALKALREDLEKQSMVLSATAKAEKEKEYKEKLEAFKEKFRASQQTLQRKDQELTRRILKDLQGVIRVLGETGGYALVVEKNEGGVLFAGQGVDITDEVIKRYDRLQEN
ncbi:MAG: OmpH family outer membrane protein [Deferrisomatales bacterium]